VPNRDIIFTLKFRNQAGQVIRKFGGQLKNLGTRSKVAGRGLDKLAKKFQKLGDATVKAGRRIKSAGAAIREAGTNIAFSIGVPIAAAVAISVKAFADFDLALAGVQKTVQGTPEQLAGLEEEFVRLSNQIPIASTQLASIGQTAGQLGVAIPDIIAFTETIAKVGVATKLSTEQAAFGLARLSNILQLPTSSVNNLASSLIALGNNFEATEEEILSLSLRLAGAGKIVGLTAGEVLGFSSALAAVGVRARAGGTAISKAFIKIANEVASGGEKVRQFAEIAGVSVDEFTKLFREDAAGALTLFIKGLGNAQKAGVNVFKVLEDLELQEVRTRDALLRLSLAGDSLARALDLGNVAFRENTALNKEAAIFFAALSSQMVILRNRFQNAAATLGKAFGPVIVEIIEKLGAFALKLQDFARRMADLPIATKRWIVVLLGALIALGPLLIGLGSFVLIIGATVAAFGPFVKGLGIFIKFVRAAAVAMRVLTAAMLTNPFVLAAVAVAALIAIFLKFKDSVIEVGGKMQTVMDFTIGLFEALRQKIGEVLAGPLELLQKVWTKIANAAIVAFNFLTPIFANVFNFLKDISVKAFVAMGVVAKGTINAMIKGIQLAALAFRTAFKIITILVSNAFGIISGNIDNMISVVVDLAAPFISVFQNIGGFIKDQFELITGTVGKFFGVVKDGLDDMAGRAKGKAVAGLEKLRAGIVKMAEAADDTKLLKGIPDAIQEGVEEAQKILASDPFGDFLALAADIGGARFAARLEAMIEEEAPVSKGLEKDLAKALDDFDSKVPPLVKTFNELFNIGLGKALDTFTKQAQDIAQLTENAFTNAFKNIEDGLLDFIETGKFNFRDFVSSILKEFNRIAIKSILGDIALKLQGKETSKSGILAQLGSILGGKGAFGETGGQVGPAEAGKEEAGGGIIGAVTAGTTAIGGFFSNLGTKFTDGLSGLGNLFMDGLTGLGNIFSSIGGFFSGGSGSSGASGGAIAGIGKLLVGLAAEGGISDSLSNKKMVPLSAFANAKRFAQGGVTSGSDRIPALLSPNEAVVPLSRNRAIPVEGMGGGTTNITFNIETSDAESFKQSRSQMLARVGAATALAQRRTT